MTSAGSHNQGESENEATDINIDVEMAVPFPSLTQAAVEAAQSPVSDTSVLTSSDKLSALPQSITTPNINRTGRSPQLQSSPRMFRSSLDGSKSYPHTGSEPVWNTFNSAGRVSRASTEGSLERAARGRSSLDSDRGSLTGWNSAKRGLKRMSHTSDPPSPHIPPSNTLPEYRKDGAESPSNHSRSRSRAMSPVRIFQQWSANLSRSHVAAPKEEEPFVPIDPFTFSFRLVPSFLFPGRPRVEEHPIRLTHTDIEAQTGTNEAGQDLPPYLAKTHDIHDKRTKSSYTFYTDTLPRIVYLHFLLRLPSMYFSRVARVFEEAEVSRPDVRRLTEGCFGASSAYQDNPDDRNGTQQYPPTGDANDPAYQDLPQITPALKTFKFIWQDFIDSLIREWKTLNLVSALLLSAILTMFQIPNAASDPLTRTAALLSLICAIMSLSYGCVFIVRFGSMRSMFRASRWAEEAQKTKTFILWNVWVLLAMPAVWMAWSMICFIVSIVSFVWRTGSVDDPEEREGLSPKAILGPRIAITAVLVLGLVYFFAIVRTLQAYGHVGSIELRKGSRFYAQSLKRRQAIAASVGNPERRGRDTERSRRSERGGMLDVLQGDMSRGRRDSVRKGIDDDDEKAAAGGLGMAGDPGRSMNPGDRSIASNP